MKVNLTLRLKNKDGTIGSRQSACDEIERCLLGLQITTPEATYEIKQVRVKGTNDV